MEREELKKEEKRRAVAKQIMENCRNELLGLYPQLDGAFLSVTYQDSREIKSVGTEGETFYYNSRFLLERYSRQPKRVRRGYLHMLLHCLYLHMLREPGYETAQWHLACDMAVEQMIHRQQQSALEMEENGLRAECFALMGEKSLSAQDIYEMLGSGRFPGSKKELSEAFAFDDHGLWEDISREKREGLRAKWEKIQAYTAENRKDQQKRRGSRRGNEQEEAGEILPGRYDYRRFLKRFAVLMEEVEMDMESFDYIFYHYGMEHYGNMPLVEPLEYKEVHKLRELVIAIDTSGSCSRETVQRFLGETYSILSQRENFFRKMRVHLVQCDAFLQEVCVIRSEEEWKAYCQNLTIQGRGGTDFRPVFEYVRDQQKRGELTNLKALIYFTDGDGIYPGSKPDYETAFVFLKKTEKMNLVPPWALRLVAEGMETGRRIS